MEWYDGKNRCCWANPKNERYIRYHDEEWGVPVHDDHKLFEMLILECFQAGLLSLMAGLLQDTRLKNITAIVFLYIRCKLIEPFIYKIIVLIYGKLAATPIFICERSKDTLMNGIISGPALLVRAFKDCAYHILINYGYGIHKLHPEFIA